MSLTLALLLACLAQLSQLGEPEGSPPPPNVLVVIADDMGVERTPAYGLGTVPNPPTPTLDLLARAGVLFRNAYSEPLCSPTRSAMLTGRHPFRTGIGRGVSWSGGSGGIEADPAELSLADVLSATHHSTAVGKWHLNIKESSGGTGFQHPILFGFDRHTGIGLNPGNDPLKYFNWTKNVADGSGNTQSVVTNTYLTTDQVDDALAAIQDAGQEPWFVWLAFNAPHTPYHVPPADLITVDVDTNSSPSELHQAAIEAMDTELGRLLGSIPAEVLDRTWIVFVGDNGSPSAALPGVFSAKGHVTEYGIHVPLIVTGPGVTHPGREEPALVGVTDIYASICEMVGAPIPTEAEDSVSFFANLIAPRQPSARNAVYSETFRPNGQPPYQQHRRAVRSERWKLVKNQPAGPVPPVGFFNIPQDPFEDDNLFPGSTQAQQDVFAWLNGLMDSLQF